MTLQEALQMAYDNELNVQTQGLWELGILVRFGDDMSGFRYAHIAKNYDEALEFIIQVLKIYGVV